MGTNSKQQMSGRQATEFDDRWPLDHVWQHIFTDDEGPHPLYHMAWAHYCTGGQREHQQAYLAGSCVSVPKPEVACNRLQEVLWQFMFPSSKALGNLIHHLVRMYFMFGENEDVRSHIDILQDTTERPRWTTLSNIVREFGPDKEQFLRNVHDSIPFHDLFPKQIEQTEVPVFKSFEDMHNRFRPFEWGLKQEELYDPHATTHLVGTRLTTRGWSTNKTLAILMRPLKALFSYVCKAESFTLEVNGNPTSLGRMDNDISGFQLGNESGPHLMAAHFWFNPVNQPVREPFKRMQTGQEMNQRGLDKSFPALMFPMGTPRGNVGLQFNRLVSLSGFNYVDHLAPHIEELGLAYERKSVRNDWLWDELQTMPSQRGLRYPLDPQAPFGPKRIMSMECANQLEEHLAAAQREDKTLAEEQAEAEATQPRKRLRVPANPEVADLLRPVEEELWEADVGETEQWHGVWRAADQEWAERFPNETGGETSKANGNVILWGGAAAIAAFFLLAR